MPVSPPPPPPPPPPSIFPPPNTQPHPTTSNPKTNHDTPPTLNIPTTPPNTTSILVSLLIHNGWPFADHWEYFVASPTNPDMGIVVQAAGDVRGGFWLEVKRGLVVALEGRGCGVAAAGRCRRVALGWAGRELFDGEDVFPLVDGGDGGEGDARLVVEGLPRCEFERVLFKVPAPEKTLRTVGVDGDGGEAGRRTKITQRNCQTWVVESAEQLVREGIFEQQVVDYLRATSIMETS